MKLFQTILNQYETVGIQSTKIQWVQEAQFNRKILIGFSLFGWSIFAQLVYMFHVANDLMDYVECLCANFGSIITLVCFLTIVFERRLLFESIDNFEKLIEASKAILMYDSFKFEFVRRKSTTFMDFRM